MKGKFGTLITLDLPEACQEAKHRRHGNRGKRDGKGDRQAIRKIEEDVDPNVLVGTRSDVI